MIAFIYCQIKINNTIIRSLYTNIISFTKTSFYKWRWLCSQTTSNDITKDCQYWMRIITDACTQIERCIYIKIRKSLGKGRNSSNRRQLISCPKLYSRIEFIFYYLACIIWFKLGNTYIIGITKYVLVGFTFMFLKRKWTMKITKKVIYTYISTIIVRTNTNYNVV